MNNFFQDVDSPLRGEIHYSYEDTNFRLEGVDRYSSWIKEIIEIENNRLDLITYIFCSDRFLHQINVEHLNHDTLTDIITFPLSNSQIESDIFISIDRVTENAETFKVTFEQELKRVMIHGVLHLCGYGDKTDDEKSVMRAKETEAVNLFKVKI